MRNLLIVGAGQYGMVAKEIAESMGAYDKISFLDDANPIAVGKLNDYPQLNEEYQCAVVAIGNPELRLELLSELKNPGYEFPVLIHPKAYVYPTAEIAEGTIIEPMAVIHTEVKIGLGCLISAGAVINHNAVIEKGCHIDCGAIVGARKIIEERTTTKYGVILTE